MLNVPMTEKYTENSDGSNDCFDKTKIKELFDNEKISDVSDVSDNLKEMQWKMVDDDDGLNLNYENKIQLEMFEKELERLKKQNELITDKVHLITNKYKFRNDQITMIKVETDNVQNEMKKIHDRKIKKELENVIRCKTIIDKMARIHSHIDNFKVIVNNLETAVEETSENKKIMTEIMELSEYMKNQYCFEVTENQRHFTEQISKHVREIEQLNAYMNIKSKEVDEWEKRITDQQLCITMHQKLLIRVEKYITDMIQLEEIHTESLKMWEIQDMTIDDD
ncbi:hypothetical protein AGLY_001338 [Aphis glycines]|uniref:Uncharacterized protein n=1 Tax=Aphis glycines TaxID=307491 RepID=A0A6G0U6C1_APHGL|nr:hypothetical protein AGLY_001338 [Aphis glycines]